MSGVPGMGVKGTWGFDSGGGGAVVLCGERLTASVFSASWTERKREINAQWLNSGRTEQCVTRGEFQKVS